MSHNQSIQERIIALVEEGNLTTAEAGRWYGVPDRTVRRWSEQYLVFGETSKRAGTGFWHVSSQAEDAQLMDEAQENPFLNSVQLKRNTAFPSSPRTIRNHMTEAGLRSGSAAVKEKLSEEHRLYRLALAEDNMHRDWGNVIFSDESVFSSANDGPVRVYRPQGTHYNAEYVKESACSGRVSVAVCGWISSRRIRLLHKIDGRLDGAQNLHILRDTVPSVQEMYPDGVINFQQDQSPVHKSQLLQGWLTDQNEVELLDWPPCGTDLNQIENVWAETKRVMAENWPDPSPASKNALWDVVLGTWEEVAHSEVYAATLVESLPRRMQMVIDSEGYWTPY
jgi:transposase-like protein